MNFFKVKSGFTLMELMIYIALLGVIVLIAGQAFSDSTKMRVRTQGMLQASQVAANAATIFRQDVAQLGAKSAALNDNFDISHIHDVYMDPDNTDDTKKDSSSFKIGVQTYTDHGKEKHLDSITMRRLRYKPSGEFDAVEEVSWFVEEHVLKRSCKTIAQETEDANCPSGNTPSIVSIAENVHGFKLIPGKPSVSVGNTRVFPSSAEGKFKLVSRFGEENFDPVNVDPEDGGNSIQISGFSANFNFITIEPITNVDEIKANQVFLVEYDDDGSGSWSARCARQTLEPYIEYEISFSIPLPTEEDSNVKDPFRMFCAGRDHMAVGFRFAENGKKPDGLNDFQFYPPTVGDGKDTGFRRMRFTTNETIADVCLGFTFALFSPVASSGTITLENVMLEKIPSSNYTFSDDAIATADKKNVKAIKMELSIEKNGEEGTETAIIPVLSNGPRD